MAARIVLHIDVNSAFLSWSAAQHLREGGSEDYRDFPSAVAPDSGDGRGIILAKSMPAKKFGVQTGEAIWIAKQKCPGLVLVQPDYDLYLRSSRAMKALLFDYSPAVEPFSIDECFLDYTGQERFFGPPCVAAHTIKERIKNELGFTVNVGVGESKALAKMASEFEKPDRVHTLLRAELAEKLWPREIEFLFMAGRKSVQKLRRVGILTVGDVVRSGPVLMRELLGKSGELLYQYATGTDAEPVREGELPPPKSLSKSITLGRPLPAVAEGERILLYIAYALNHKLRQRNMEARVVGVAVKDADRHCTGQQQRAAQPLCHSGQIYAQALPLLHALWPPEGARYICLSLGELRPRTAIDDEFFGRDRQKDERLDEAVYALKCRFGRNAVQPAALLNSGVDKLFRQIDEDLNVEPAPRFY